MMPEKPNKNQISEFSSKLSSPRSLYILKLSGIIIIVLLAWNSLNYISAGTVHYDSSIFSSIGFHLLKGKNLYSEIWDNKPPVIFLLNGAALYFGDQTINSVRIMERIFTVAGALLIFAILFSYFKSYICAFSFALLFPFVHTNERILEGGNHTEEYGVIFILSGILISIFARKKAGAASLLLSAAAGFVFSLAAHTKEPFILSSVVWFVFIVWDKDKKCKINFKRALCFIAGALVPAAVFSIWLIKKGTLKDYFDIFSYSAAYSAILNQGSNRFLEIWRNFSALSTSLFNQFYVLALFFTAGLVCVADKKYLRNLNYFPVFAAVSFIFEFTGSGISTRCFGHYYAQIIPSFFMISACGAYYTIKNIAQLKKYQKNILLAALIILGTFDIGSISSRLSRSFSSPERYDTSPLAIYITKNSNEKDTIWVCDVGMMHIYLECQRLSPSHLLYFSPHYLLDTKYSTKEEKLKKMTNDIINNPPKFIIGRYNYSQELKSFIDSNYEKISIENGEFILLKRI